MKNQIITHYKTKPIKYATNYLSLRCPDHPFIVVDDGNGYPLFAEPTSTDNYLTLSPSGAFPITELDVFIHPNVATELNIFIPDPVTYKNNDNCLTDN